MTIISDFSYDYTLLALKSNISFDNEVKRSVYQTTTVVEEEGYIVVCPKEDLATTDKFKKVESVARLLFAKDKRINNND